MLLPIHSDTPKCQIFEKLNEELLHFLESSIDSAEFGQHLFSDEIGSVCFNNQPTCKKFDELWQELNKLQRSERQSIHSEISAKQSIESFFSNRELTFPEISNPKVLEKLDALTNHLFKATKDLSGLCSYCEPDGIDEHFASFRSLNGNVCLVCGTELLAQVRANTQPTGRQWRADYDHILPKNRYPSYAIHPDNLCPICQTCNQKAKGTRDLLVYRSGVRTGTRRRSFFPTSNGLNCAGPNLSVSITDPEASPEIKISWAGSGDDTTEKLESWDDVYEVRSRVKGYFADLAVNLDTTLKPSCLDDFRRQIERHSTLGQAELKTSEWAYWRFKLFQWLNTNGSTVVEQLWAMIEATRDDSNARVVFGR